MNVAATKVDRASKTTRLRSSSKSGWFTLLFCGVFFAMGLLFFGGMMVTIVWPEIRANHEFVETVCTVDRAEVTACHGDDNDTYRPDVTIHYEVAGQNYSLVTYEVTRTSASHSWATRCVQQFVIGQQYPCWYDPSSPGRALLARGYSWFLYLFLALPITFMGIGGWGVWLTLTQWGYSPERSAAPPILASERFPSPRLSDAGLFPSVPPAGKLVKSASASLPFRLRPETSPGVLAVGLLVVGCFWNGMAGAFLAVVIAAHLRGKPEWFADVLLVPFVLVGGFVSFKFFKQLLIALGGGKTLVEISRHPLLPGDDCEVLLSQSGRLSLRSLIVLLACDEKTAYMQGSNKRSEHRRVHQVELINCQNIRIRRGVPLTQSASFTIPQTAMHSFKADFNELQWRLIVRGDVVRWPSFVREFPFVVQPISSGR